MPYICEESRRALNDDLQQLIARIKELFIEDHRHGAVNYVITNLVLSVLRPCDGWRYHTLQKAYGVFFCAAAEFYRRVIAPYEDLAIKKNGDLLLLKEEKNGEHDPSTP